MSPMPRSSAINSRTLGLRAAASKWRLDAELVLPGSVLPPVSGAALVIATHARSRAARLCPRERRVRYLMQGNAEMHRASGRRRGTSRCGCFSSSMCVRAHRSGLRRGTLGGWRHCGRLGVTRRSRGLVAGSGPADGGGTL
eukprot:scaffold22676_cov60-Phaeocystis_antarctica.AAC.3